MNKNYRITYVTSNNQIITKETPYEIDAVKSLQNIVLSHKWSGFVRSPEGNHVIGYEWIDGSLYEDITGTFVKIL